MCVLFDEFNSFVQNINVDLQSSDVQFERKFILV